ncbi:MAG: GntR family transcriptional regulator [Butyricicoccus sp.]|nr:GntR family transcriptional regulator [Butyricicoccus sp.]
MDIIISNASGRPIYEQIYAQIKKAVISGELSAGDALPSIRALAKDLRISVITTKRAYDELEKDGYINTVAGKGCYVAPKDMNLVREGQLMEIEGCMRRVLELAGPLGLGRAELAEMFAMLEEENKIERDRD